VGCVVYCGQLYPRSNGLSERMMLELKGNSSGRKRKLSGKRSKLSGKKEGGLWREACTE